MHTYPLSEVLAATRIRDELSHEARFRDPRNLIHHGDKRFSQSDEDGIVEEIFARIGTTSRRFVEVGVQDGLESNTLALLLSGWRGTWVEADDGFTTAIGSKFRQAIEDGRLQVLHRFVAVDNAEAIAADCGSEAIDLLSIDIDGNDFHVAPAFLALHPRALIVEYNARFGPHIDWVMPYDAGHRWDGSDYFGASLAAWQRLLAPLDYALVSCNLLGSNAFFVRRDCLQTAFHHVDDRDFLFEPPRYHLLPAYQISHKLDRRPGTSYVAGMLASVSGPAPRPDRHDVESTSNAQQGRPTMFDGDDRSMPLPTLESLTSQVCTSNQFSEPAYDRLCVEIAQEKLFHRKQWEYIYILRALEQAGVLRPGSTGLGFGCGKEPLAAVMAKRGVDVVCTDIAPVERGDAYWGSTDVRDYFYDGICSWDVFERHVRFRPADMNAIPDDLGQHDFIWSSCALEHLGSLQHGIDFVLDANKCLKAGGVAVHTTELNVEGDAETFESVGLSLYRRKDILRLRDLVEEQGHSFMPINFNMGDGELDRYVDLPPYNRNAHLKLMVEENYVTTSIGFVIVKR